MNKLKLAPEESGYSFEFPAYSLASDIGQNHIYGNELIGKWLSFAVNWICDKKEFNYLENVYRAHEASGHAPFFIDLLVAPKTMQEKIAIIVPGTFKLDANAGETFYVSCILEVKP